MNLKDSSGKLLRTLYFSPITRFDRQKAQQLAGTDEALTVSTQLLCKMAQKKMEHQLLICQMPQSYKGHFQKRF